MVATSPIHVVCDDLGDMSCGRRIFSRLLHGQHIFDERQNIVVEATRFPASTKCRVIRGELTACIYIILRMTKKCHPQLFPILRALSPRHRNAPRPPFRRQLQPRCCYENASSLPPSTVDIVPTGASFVFDHDCAIQRIAIFSRFFARKQTRNSCPQGVVSRCGPQPFWNPPTSSTRDTSFVLFAQVPLPEDLR